MKTDGIHNLVDSAASVAWKPVVSQVHPYLEVVCEPFRNHRRTVPNTHLSTSISQAPEDYRCCKEIRYFQVR